MIVNAIAIDDEPLALEIIKDFSAKMQSLQLQHCFYDAVEGREYIEKHKPDLLFIDIDMPDINGLELVNSLQYKPIIVFTTAYKEFALEGFELEAVDYLLKPFSFERFEKAIQKATSAMQLKTASVEKEESNLFVFADYRMVKIPAADIIYIESLDDYIKIHLQSAKPVMTLMSLKKVLEALPNEAFARIHRSYIVSLKYIHSLSARKVILTNGSALAVSESHFEPLNKKLKIR